MLPAAKATDLSKGRIENQYVGTIPFPENRTFDVGGLQFTSASDHFAVWTDEPLRHVEACPDFFAEPHHDKNPVSAGRLTEDLFLWSSCNWRVLMIF